MGCCFDVAYQLSLCVSGVRTDTFKSYHYSICRKGFAFQVSAFATVQGIAKVGSEFLHVHRIYTTAYFFIRCEEDADLTMSDLRMLYQISGQVHDDSYAGLII